MRWLTIRFTAAPARAVKLWLEPLKFVGLALLLSSIGLALATIVRALRWQANRLWEIIS